MLPTKYEPSSPAIWAPPSKTPVTGSLNALLAQWLFAVGLTESSYVAPQGTFTGRKGRIHLARDDSGQVWVGGETHTHVKGKLLSP